LAAIAIPAYIDYTIKAKISEVTNSFDALATAASEYHASYGGMPPLAYGINNLASLPGRYGAWAISARGGADNETYQFTFNSRISSAVNGNTITQKLLYDSVNGYQKSWGGTIEPKYRPRE
jgi:Pilin (bacterial filament).